MGVQPYEATADGSDFDQLWTEGVAKAAGRIDNVGLYPEATASYIIFKVGSTYYRRDGETGLVDDSNADAVTLFDTAIDSGRRIYVKSGTYEWSSALSKNVHELQLVGEARYRPFEGATPVVGSGVVFEATAVMNHILQIGDGTDEYRNNLVRDIKFDCTDNADYGLITNGWNDGTVERCMSEDAVLAAFLFTGTGSYPTSNVDVRNCWGGYSDNGFQANASSEELTFYKCLSYINDNAGFQLSSVGAWSIIDSLSMSDALMGLYANIYKTCELHYYRVLGGSGTTTNGMELYLQNDAKAQLNIFGGYIEDCSDNGMEYTPNGTTNQLNIYGLRVTGCTNYALDRLLTNGRVNYLGGSVQGNGSPVFNGLQVADKILNVMGYVTENAGTGSITNGGTTDVITHGCDYTPVLADITITLGENPTNTPGAIWVDTIGAANFTVNCENDPGASNLDFSWAVRKAS